MSEVVTNENNEQRSIQLEYLRERQLQRVKNKSKEQRNMLL
jgi:hypothetical protein